MAYGKNRNRRNLGNNPTNPDSTLFKKLTRLFSGPIINYRQQHARKLRRHKLDKYASTFRSASGQQFKKKSYNPYDHIMTGMMKHQHRSERYGDFDQMEYTPELASALDIYADEITTHTQFSKVLKIECPNEEIKSILETKKLNEDVLTKLTNILTTVETLKENCMWRIIRAAKQNHMLD